MSASFRLSYILVFQLLLSHCISQSTDQVMEWGETVRSSGTHEIIGISGNDIFVSSISAERLFSKSPELTLLKFDDQHNFKADYNLKNILGKNNRLVDIVADDSGICVLVMNGEKKSAYFLEKIFIDPASLKITKRAPLAQLKIQSSFPLLGGNNNPTDYITTFLSADKSKLTIMFSQKLKDYTDTQILLYDRRNKFNKLNEFEIELLDDGRESEHLQDIAVNNDGSMSLLLKHYFNNNQIESDGGKPDYEFIAIQIPQEGDIIESNIRLRKRYVQHAKIKKDQAGNIVILGLYEQDSRKGAEGIVFIKMNPSGDIIKRKFIKSQAIPRGKDKLDRDFEATRFLELGDTYILVSREKELDNFNSNRNFNNPYNRRYGGLFFDPGRNILEFKNKRTIIEAIDTSGTHRWVSELNDYATQENGSHFIENGIIATEDKLLIFNNMHERNFERLGEDKMKRRMYPTNNNIVLQTIIDIDGVVSAEQLSYPTPFNIIPNDVLQIGSKIYFCGLSHRRSDIVIGSYELGTDD